MTVSETRAAEYRALRAKHPDAGSLNVWRWITAPKPHRLEWEEDGSETVGTAVVDGWEVRATIADDDTVDLADEYGTLTMSYERGAFENPYFREWHRDGDIPSSRAHDGLYDYCGSRHDKDGAARWYISGSGDTFDDLRVYYRKSGLARHEAYARALASFRERADDCRSAYTDRYGTGRYAFAFVNVTVSLAGVEITSAAYGGYSWERDYSKPLDPQLDEIVSDAVSEALADASGAVADAVERERAAADKSLERAGSVIAAARIVGGAS